MSLKRKLSRSKKKIAEKEMSKKLGLFNKLSDECLACQKPFDKKDKDMVNSWTVIVREQEKEVRLYCPECWDTARKIVKEI